MMHAVCFYVARHFVRCFTSHWKVPSLPLCDPNFACPRVPQKPFPAECCQCALLLPSQSCLHLFLQTQVVPLIILLMGASGMAFYTAGREYLTTAAEQL